jgi:hypothetical protein
MMSRPNVRFVSKRSRNVSTPVSPLKPGRVLLDPTCATAGAPIKERRLAARPDASGTTTTLRPEVPTPTAAAQARRDSRRAITHSSPPPSRRSASARSSRAAATGSRGGPPPERAGPPPSPRLRRRLRTPVQNLCNVRVETSAFKWSRLIVPIPEKVLQIAYKVALNRLRSISPRLASSPVPPPLKAAETGLSCYLARKRSESGAKGSLFTVDGWARISDPSRG